MRSVFPHAVLSHKFAIQLQTLLPHVANVVAATLHIFDLAHVVQIWLLDVVVFFWSNCTLSEVAVHDKWKFFSWGPSNKHILNPLTFKQVTHSTDH